MRSTYIVHCIHLSISWLQFASNFFYLCVFSLSLSFPFVHLRVSFCSDELTKYVLKNTNRWIVIWIAVIYCVFVFIEFDEIRGNDFIFHSSNYRHLLLIYTLKILISLWRKQFEISSYPMSTSCFFYISNKLSFTHSTFFLPVSVTFSKVNGFSFIVIFFVDWLTALQTMNEMYTFANEDKGKGIYKILYKCFSSLFQVAFPKCRQINEQKSRRKSKRWKKIVNKKHSKKNDSNGWQ